MFEKQIKIPEHEEIKAMVPLRSISCGAPPGLCGAAQDRRTCK